jgi:hypothetical protein
MAMNTNGLEVFNTEPITDERLEQEERIVAAQLDIITALRPLDPYQRRRVLAYAIDAALHPPKHEEKEQ